MKTVTVIVSANERPEVKQTYIDEGLDVIQANIPYDMELYTERGLISLERKLFPDDLLASVDDGRLVRECAAMREASEYRILISEGRGRYSPDGRLYIGRRPSRWFKGGIRNLFRSLRYVEAVDVEYTDNIKDTAACLKELQGYFDKDYHLSMRVRSKFESSWLTPTYEERFIFWLQGCGYGVSIIRARALAKVFKSPMELFGASSEDIMKVPGIGEKTASAIYNFLRGGL